VPVSVCLLSSSTNSLHQQFPPTVSTHSLHQHFPRTFSTNSIHEQFPRQVSINSFHEQSSIFSAPAAGLFDVTNSFHEQFPPTVSTTSFHHLFAILFSAPAAGLFDFTYSFHEQSPPTVSANNFQSIACRSSVVVPASTAPRDMCSVAVVYFGISHCSFLWRRCSLERLRHRLRCDKPVVCSSVSYSSLLVPSLVMYVCMTRPGYLPSSVDAAVAAPCSRWLPFFRPLAIIKAIV
jgi:hypothetical protein